MLANWLPLIKTFLEGAAKFLLGLFVYNEGKKTERLDNAEKAIEDAKDANKLNSGIESLPDSDLDNILYNDQTTDKK